VHNGLKSATHASRGEKLSCQTNPYKDENSPWETPILAWTPPRGGYNGFKHSHTPPENCPERGKCPKHLFSGWESNFGAASFSLRQYGKKFTCLTSMVRIRVKS